MDKTSSGWINGFIGVAIFAGSLPATRVAVADLDPTFLTCARASIAALLALAMLLALRQPRPARADMPSLALSALGGVVGFPLLTALALQYVTSAHSIVFVGLLPLSTAVFAVLRGGERPRPAFWLFSLAGAAFVAGLCGRGRGRGLAARRPAHAGRHHRLRPGLCRGRAPVAHAGAAGRSSAGRWCWPCPSCCRPP